MMEKVALFLLLVFYADATLSQFVSELFNSEHLTNDTDVKQGLWFSPEKHQIYRKAEPPPPPAFNDPQDTAWNLLDGGMIGHRDALTEERLQHHLHFIMSSTADQPDSGGRSSNFNFWLTLLIAAVAAAILS